MVRVVNEAVFAAMSEILNVFQGAGDLPLLLCVTAFLRVGAQVSEGFRRR